MIDHWPPKPDPVDAYFELSLPYSKSYQLYRTSWPDLLYDWCYWRFHGFNKNKVKGELFGPINDHLGSCRPIIKIKKLKYKKTYIFSGRNVFTKKIAGELIVAKAGRQLGPYHRPRQILLI